MKKIKIFAILCCLILLLSSCNISQFDSENLLTPPQMNASNQQIHDALTSSIGGSYDLVYPKTGNYHNPIISIDLTGDGVAEALCFYTTEQDKSVYISVLKKNGDSWNVKGVSQNKSAGAQLHSIDFFDFDKDGTKEIVVSWQSSSSEELAIDIYNFVGSELKNMFTGLYNNILVLDDTLVTVSKNSGAKTATASIIGKKGDSLKVLGTAALSTGVVAFTSVQSAYSGENSYTVFIDEQLESSLYTTEVLRISKKNDIANVTVELGIPLSRNSSVVCADVNSDGMPDLPVERAFPSYRSGDKSENLYYMDWHSIKGGTAEHIMNAYTSVNEHFLLRLPEEWTDSVTIQKDKSSDRRINILMLGDEGATPMFSLRVFSQQEFTDDVKAKEWQSVVTNGENVYAILQQPSDLLPQEFFVDTKRFSELFTIMN